jgi:hypothetical protein
MGAPVVKFPVFSFVAITIVRFSPNLSAAPPSLGDPVSCPKCLQDDCAPMTQSVARSACTMTARVESDSALPGGQSYLISLQYRQGIRKDSVMGSHHRSLLSCRADLFQGTPTTVLLWRQFLEHVLHGILRDKSLAATTTLHLLGRNRAAIAEATRRSKPKHARR